MTTRTRKTRATRPSPLLGIGNPADADPDDGAAGPDAARHGNPPDSPSIGPQRTPRPPAPDSAPPVHDDPPQAQGASPGPPRRADRHRATTPRPTTPKTTPPTDHDTPDADTTATRPGRPRVPRPGPVTRVTVDLALNEQRDLEKLTATIARKIGRDRGRQRLYVQHLMRVATRRLLTDTTFRDHITQDLAEHRDTLKRE